ncbi:MAG: 50S ribosomal protein L11 methyltransferase [Thermoleophilaceae bacterium]|nr:50S ribosomal protein L11 methyltransferase [Thermoleophilaceae bacterium]
MIRLAVRAPVHAAEQVLGAVLEMAPSGVEQVDGDGWVEYAVYGAPGELPELAVGEAEVGGVLVTVSGTEVPSDWEERWKRFHQPVLIAKRIYVRPPWEEPLPGRPEVIDLVIDPGRAFGTGAHPTTRLCLELLVELAGQEGARGSVSDLGCGSGVLSIAAARLGFGPVCAYDSDGLAVEATALNAAENGVALERIERADLRARPAPVADLVVANLMRPLLLRVAALFEHTPKVLILSGLMEHEADEVAAAFGPSLQERRRLTDRGWSAVLLSA